MKKIRQDESRAKNRERKNQITQHHEQEGLIIEDDESLNREVTKHSSGKNSPHTEECWESNAQTSLTQGNHIGPPKLRQGRSVARFPS
jgi:hypothetical protein